MSADVAVNGREALHAWERGDYDLILMDCRMPEMDGFEATDEIRRREAGRSRIPIIALTAHAIKGDRERCLSAGMDDHLSKPVDPDQLHEAIAHWSGRGGRGREQPSTEATPERHDGESERDALMRRFGANEAVIAVLTHKFCDRLSADLEELRKVLSAQDVDAAVSLAHGLKGAAANLEAREIRLAAERLETAIRSGDREQVTALLEELERAATSYVSRASAPVPAPAV